MVSRTDEGKRLLSIVHGDLCIMRLHVLLFACVNHGHSRVMNGIVMSGEITRLGHQRIVPRTTLLQRFE